MNDVDISFEGMERPNWTDGLERFALAALERLGKENWDLSILLCDDAFIRDLNRRYRDRDEPTDVLSFPQEGEYLAPDGSTRVLAGDIVISLPGLDRNVVDFSVSKDEELRRLVVHGILHLSGMDHEDEDPERPMLKLQEEILSGLSEARIL